MLTLHSHCSNTASSVPFHNSDSQSISENEPTGDGGSENQTKKQTSPDMTNGWFYLNVKFTCICSFNLILILYQRPISSQWFIRDEIMKSTTDFSIVIGKGGFGTVYRGMYHGTVIAVKVLNKVRTFIAYCIVMYACPEKLTHSQGIIIYHRVGTLMHKHTVAERGHDISIFNICKI